MYEEYPQYVVAWQPNATSILAVKIPRGSEAKFDKLLTSKKTFRVKGKTIPAEQILGLFTEADYRNLKTTMFKSETPWEQFSRQAKQSNWYHGKD